MRRRGIYRHSSTCAIRRDTLCVNFILPRAVRGGKPRIPCLTGALASETTQIKFNNLFCQAGHSFKLKPNYNISNTQYNLHRVQSNILSYLAKVSTHTACAGVWQQILPDSLFLPLKKQTKLVMFDKLIGLSSIIWNFITRWNLGQGAEPDNFH